MLCGEVGNEAPPSSSQKGQRRRENSAAAHYPFFTWWHEINLLRNKNSDLQMMPILDKLLFGQPPIVQVELIVYSAPVPGFFQSK